MLQQRQQEQEERLAKVSLHIKFCTGRGDKRIKSLVNSVHGMTQCMCSSKLTNFSSLVT